MIGSEINVDIHEETDEERAKKVIEAIRERIADIKIDVKKAEDKLSEVLLKDIKDITKKDGYWYEWD